MRIFVTGTRGIPDIPGGIERHCEALYPRIVRRSHEVILATRPPYVLRRSSRWKGVWLVPCYCPRRRHLEAIVHTALALVRARRFRPDLVHIHGIGPALTVPLARMAGYRVVVTHHGPDYDRQKWGRVAKAALRAGEWLGCRYAHAVIAISEPIREIVRRRCGRTAHRIPNGVRSPDRRETTDYLERIGVTPGDYVLAVARFVPEKGLHDLITAFRGMDRPVKLVIAGDADHPDDYSRRLRRMAGGDPRIVLTGYITGDPLAEVYSHAGLFVLPSYHEGLPIALLEAMSYGRSVLVSDIPANREVGLPADRYFRAGDPEDLRVRMEKRLDIGWTTAQGRQLRLKTGRTYNWDRIAEATAEVYRDVLAEQRGLRICDFQNPKSKI